MFDYPVAALAQLGFFFYSFHMFGKYAPAKAGSLVVLTGLLFLPEVTLFRVLDNIAVDKNKIVFLGTLFGLMLRHSNHLRSARPVSTLVLIMLPLLVINIIGWQTNLTTLFSQGAFQRGLSFSWVLGQSIDDFFRFALPFAIAKALIKNVQDLKTFFYVGVGMGLVYTFLALVELLLAIPFRVFQLSHYIYSVPTRPQFRYGLTEPVVFLSLGHSLATFMVFPFVASIALLKSHAPISWKGITRARSITLIGLLSTLKVASSLLGVAAAGAMFFLRTRVLSAVLGLAALVVLIYPLAQVFDIFPEDFMVNIAAEYNAERGGSLAGRFYEEEFVIERMGSRLLFGWGHFGRIPDGDIVGAESGETGLDAWWVIQLGMSGLFGVLYVLFLLAVPIFSIRKRFAVIESEETKWLLCGLMVCLLLRIVDLLQNGWWNSLPMFFSGALMGISLAIKRNPSAALNLIDAPLTRLSRSGTVPSKTHR